MVGTAYSRDLRLLQLQNTAGRSGIRWQVLNLAQIHWERNRNGFHDRRQSDQKPSHLGAE